MVDRYHARRAESRRRPWEFKKKLAAWAVVIATAATVASFVLAAMVSSPTPSATEKVSRNRHGLDADGFPLDTEQEENRQ